MRSNLRSSALIDAWFDMLPQQSQTVRELQAAVLAAQPSLVQTVKWGNLVFMHAGLNLLAIVTHKTHANLQVFNGAPLVARFPQLDGTGRGLRHLKMRYGASVDAQFIAQVVRASVELADLQLT